MIRHTVVFRLKHAVGTEQEQAFLEAAGELGRIPGVKNFECLRQISKKNPYEYGLCMEFSSQRDYQAYNDHPEHTRFVQSRWMHEVAEFMEIDYDVPD